MVKRSAAIRDAIEKNSLMSLMIFRKTTFAATILISASTTISKVMFWWKFLTACHVDMMKHRFSIDTPMDNAQGYSVPSTKLHVPAENP